MAVTVCVSDLHLVLFSKVLALKVVDTTSRDIKSKVLQLRLS